MSSHARTRSIITPESFTVAPQLLGLPLARPARRAAAILFDLVPVAFLANVGIGVFLVFLAAFLTWRMLAFLTRNRASTWKTLVRGAFSLLILITGLRIAGSSDSDDDAANANAGPSPDSITALTQGVQQQILAQLGITIESHEPDGSAATDSPLLRYAAALQHADSQAMDSLRPLATRSVAGDRIRALEQGMRALSEEIQETEQEKDELRDQLRQRSGRLTAWISAAAETLGIGFGWGALYFTAFLTLGKGQTPGKRLMGIRVIRLDAWPITWIIAFERFGGYFASISTGLLGFLQIFWDRNRQALHDKVVETVVIRVRSDSPIPTASSTNAQPARH